MLTRMVQVLLVAGLLTGTSWGATNPFVGDWKLDSSKSRLIDRMAVARAGGGKYTFDLGGEPETITLDGTDQPGVGGTTLSVIVLRPDAWKVIRKRNGHVLLTANWQLSRDGSALADDFTSFGRDGKPSNVKYVYKRTTPGSGFLGTWVSTSEAVNFVYVLEIRPYADDGLSIIDATSQLTRNVKFDGKDHPNSGASAAMIAESAARRIDAHTLELTDRKSDGKLYSVRRLELSSDLKSLTITPRADARGRPYVLVFERE